MRGKDIDRKEGRQRTGVKSSLRFCCYINYFYKPSLGLIVTRIKRNDKTSTTGSEVVPITGGGGILDQPMRWVLTQPAMVRGSFF